MTEQDILKHAKRYLGKLAVGIDPLTGEPVPSDDVVRKEGIAKCLTYVSDVLEILISQGEPEALPAHKQQRLPAFAITEEALSRVQVSEKPVTITELGKSINAQIDQECVDKLKTASLLEYLDKHGFLEMRPLPNGRNFPLFFPYGGNSGRYPVVLQTTENSYFTHKSAQKENKKGPKVRLDPIRIQSLGPCRVFITDLSYEHPTFFFHGLLSVWTAFLLWVVISG